MCEEKKCREKLQDCVVRLVVIEKTVANLPQQRVKGFRNGGVTPDPHSQAIFAASCVSQKGAPKMLLYSTQQPPIAFKEGVVS